MRRTQRWDPGAIGATQFGTTGTERERERLAKRDDKSGGGRLKKAARAARYSRDSGARDKRWRLATHDEDLDAAETRDQKMRRSKEDLPSELVKRVAETMADVDFSSPDTKVGLVVGVRRRQARVLLDGDEIDCRIPTELAVFQRMTLGVGDQVAVVFEERGAAAVAVAPRKSKLSRPDPRIPGMERVVAANIDLALIVASAKQPAFNPRLVDRYLVAAQAGGAEALVCVNKLDLVDGLPEDARAYESAGVRVVGASCVDGRGIEDLTAAIQGKTCVIVGHSGVGKTTIVKAIDPGVEARTEPVRQSDGRGRHATTFSCLYVLSCGARVIDTPGVREFGLWRMSREDLSFYFREFEGLAACRFRNCTHTHEPGCAVKDAVERGDIARARYESYVRIYDSL